MDAVYRSLRGVHDVVSGYIGGALDDPTYEQVCTGLTGHAEAVEVIFDEDVLPLAVVLDVFFTLHDPTQLNRQGADVGTQYRSAKFYRDEDERAVFEAALVRAAEIWGGGVVTTLEPATTFYRAEEYHQDFFAKNPGQGYCMAVAVPKVAKVRKSFATFIK